MFKTRCSQSLVLLVVVVVVLQEKLSSFRIKELKDVLTQLGLSKQGKKQVIIFLLIVFVALTGHCLNSRGANLEYCHCE